MKVSMLCLAIGAVFFVASTSVGESQPAEHAALPKEPDQGRKRYYQSPSDEANPAYIEKHPVKDQLLFATEVVTFRDGVTGEKNVYRFGQKKTAEGRFILNVSGFKGEKDGGTDVPLKNANFDSAVRDAAGNVYILMSDMGYRNASSVSTGQRLIPNKNQEGPNQFLFVIKLLPNGEIDSKFGRKGIETLSISARENANIEVISTRDPNDLTGGRPNVERVVVSGNFMRKDYEAPIFSTVTEKKFQYGFLLNPADGEHGDTFATGRPDQLRKIENGTILYAPK